MINIIFSIVVGLGGGGFQIKGDDIVSTGFGPSTQLIFEMDMTPYLVYSIGLEGGRTSASTNSMILDTLGIPTSATVGNNFEYMQGVFSLKWYPLKNKIRPYLSTRLGLKKWRFTDDEGITMSLNGNYYNRYSLILGGGGGVSVNISNFVISFNVISDFIFSVDNDWYEGFGTGDNNEYTIGLNMSIGRSF